MYSKALIEPYQYILISYKSTIFWIFPKCKIQKRAVKYHIDIHLFVDYKTGLNIPVRNFSRNGWSTNSSNMITICRMQDNIHKWKKTLSNFITLWVVKKKLSFMKQPLQLSGGKCFTVRLYRNFTIVCYCLLDIIGTTKRLLGIRTKFKF